MRILVFCDEELDAAAGGARQVLELVRELAARDHEIRLIAPIPSSGPEAVAPIPQVVFRYAPVLRAAGMRPLSYLLTSTTVMTREMIGWRPEALLWFDSPGQVGPLLCARLAGCPIALFANGLPAEEVRGVWRWGPLTKLLTSLLKLAARRAAAVVSVCPEITVWMQSAWGIPAGRCHVIRNGVDTLRFRPQEAQEARRRLELEERAHYIGFVGGFFPWHGLETLVEAVPAVLREMPDARFLLVGEGQTRADLEARVRQMGLQEAVRFPGRVRFDEVPRWIAACDVCVVLHRPTRFYPGDSMKLWEYQACARPVVASAGPGYGDTVEAIGSGVSVKPADPLDLARGLVDLLRDPEQRATMGRRGREAMQAGHTWRARAAQLDTVLREAVIEGMRREHG
ncbi:MAG: glycosyltransferase family 4 protein [Nitrospiraceae bacterium]